MFGTHGCKRCMQCLQRGRPLRCGLIGFFQSEQCHCQYDITPPANEGECCRYIAAIAAAFEGFRESLQVATWPEQ